MKTKHIFSIALLGILTSCGDGNDFGKDYEPSLSVKYLKIESENVVFEASEDLTQTIQVHSVNVPWTISGMDEWVTVSPSSGIGDQKVTISVKSNSNSTEARSCKLTLSSTSPEYAYNQEIKVSQETDTRTFVVTGNNKTVSFAMKRVKKGKFIMGKSYNEHEVTLTKNYYIGVTEVTQALWYVLMGEVWNGSYGIGDEYPAYYISYNECIVFIEKLNKLTGEKFRLPTEAEWEYAAKGGLLSRGYTYSGSNILNNVAWNVNNSNDTTHPVKTKQANELGLYDMSGNVAEWCSDWYGDLYHDAETDPVGPSSGTKRVMRGGYFDNLVKTSDWYDTSRRNYEDPSSAYRSNGFRLAL